MKSGGSKRRKVLSHSWLEDFQVHALRGVAAQNAQKSAKCFDCLAALANQLAHIALTHFDRDEHAQFVDTAIDRELLFVLHKIFEDVADERQTRDFLSGISHVG